MVEDYGKLHSRFFATKNAGMFSKNPKIMNIHHGGLIFYNPNITKANKDKDKEITLYQDILEISLPDKAEKEILVKGSKQTFSLVCADRVTLATDLLYYKDLDDMKRGSYKPKEYIGFKQINFSDSSSKVPISLVVLKSALHIKILHEKSGEEEKKAKEEKELNYRIRFLDIESIISHPTGFIIDKKYEKEKLIFDSDSLGPISAELKKTSEDILKLELTFKGEESFLEKKIIEPNEFATPAKAIKLGMNTDIDSRLHVDVNNLLEEDIKTMKIMKSQELSTLIGAKVVRHCSKTKDDVVKLNYPHLKSDNYKMRSQELDYLLSSLMYSAMTKDDLDNIPMIIMGPGSYKAKIYGLPIENEIYEGSLVKEINDIVGALPDNEIGLTDDRFASLILEAALNGKFRNQGTAEAKLVQNVFRLYQDYSVQIKKSEESPDIVTSYFAYLLNKDNSDTPGKALFLLYSRLLPLLALGRILLSSRITIPDIATFQKQLMILLDLTQVKNSLVSFFSSLVIRTMLKQSKTGEKRLETAAKKWIIKELDLISSISSSAQKYMGDSHKEICPYLQLYGIISIFEVILLEKREGMSPEELGYIISSILDQDKILDMIEQLSLYNSKPILYQATLIAAQTLLLVYNSNDKDMLKVKQKKILNSTMLLLWNIQLLLSSASVRQQRLSASVASLIVVGNPACCELMARIFPKSLLKKVDSEKKYIEWIPDHWKEFFVLVQNNYNTPTEQWGEDTRKELITQLKSSAIEFMKAKYDVKKEGERPVWNHEEFEVSYQTLEHKCQVGKYYLVNLYNKGEKNTYPYLNENVTKPLSFWNALVYKFAGSTNLKERQLILSVMNLTYQDHFQMIREIKILPHLVHLLELDEAKQLYSFLLELFLTVVKKPEVPRNYRLFVKSYGLENIFNILSRTYIPHKKLSVRKPFERLKRAKLIVSILDAIINNSQKSEMRKSWQNQSKELSRSQVDANTAILKNIFPDCKIRIICRKRNNLASIVQLLLVQSDEIVKRTIKFLGNHFMYKRFLNVKECGIVDILMYVLCVDPEATEEIISLLCSLQELCGESFNADLDFNNFSRADKELITNNEKIKSSLFLRFFPVPFVKFIVEENNTGAISAIYKKSNHKQADLIWSKTMRALLEEKIKLHMSPFLLELDKFVSKKGGKGRTVEQMPVYSESFKEIIKFPEIENEIRCAEFYLREWNEWKGTMEGVHQVIFMKNLDKTFSEVAGDGKAINLDNLTILLTTFYKTLKTFSKKPLFESFPTLYLIMTNFADNINQNEITRKFLKKLLKFTYHCIKTGENFSAFEKSQGMISIANIALQWMIHVEKKQATAGIDLLDLSGIRWIFAILQDSIERNFNLWESVDYTKRETILRKLFNFLLRNLKNESYFLNEIDSAKPLNVIKLTYKIDDTLKVVGVEKGAKNDKIVMDNYTKVIFIHTTELIFYFLASLSLLAEAQKELILSGFGYLGLYQCNLPERENSMNLLGVTKIYGLLILRRITYFALKALGNSVVAGKEILCEFGKIIKALISDYVIQVLIADIDGSAGVRIKEAAIYEPFRELIKVVIERLSKDMEHPYFIWNADTRSQFVATVNDRIEFHLNNSAILDSSFSSFFSGFRYKSYEKEIIVEGVFLRLLNKDPYMRLMEPAKFLASLAKEVSQVKLEDILKNEELANRLSYLMESMANMIIYQKGMDLNIVSGELINHLCGWLSLEQSEKPSNIKGLETIHKSIYGILSEIAKDTRYSGKVLCSPKFRQYSLSILIQKSSIASSSPLSNLTKMLLGIFESSNSRDNDDAIVSQGYLVLFFLQIFATELDKKQRATLFKIIQEVLKRNKLDGKMNYLGCLIPVQLLHQFIDSGIIKSAEDWVNKLDVEEERDIELIYNSALHKKISELLEIESKKIIAESSADFQYRYTNDQYIAQFINQGEIVVTGVIIRSFIKSPTSKIKAPFNLFIETLQKNIIHCLKVLTASRGGTMPGGQIKDDFSSPKKETEENKEVTSSVGNSQKENLEQFQKGIFCMVAALILAYEQEFKNAMASTHKSAIHGGDMASTSRKTMAGMGGMIPSGKEKTLISSEALKELMYLGLRSTNSIELNMMLLELLYIIFEQKEIMVDKDELEVITVAIIQCLIDDMSTVDSSRKVIEIITFSILCKIMEKIGPTKGKDQILDIFMMNDFLEKLKIMYMFRSYLKTYIETFMNKIFQYPAYYKLLHNEKKYELSPEIKLEKIFKGKYEPLDKFWRRIPPKTEDMKAFYDKINYVEEFDLGKMGIQFLPIISKKCFDIAMFEQTMNLYMKMTGEDPEKLKVRASAPGGDLKGPFESPKK